MAQRKRRAAFLEQEKANVAMESRGGGAGHWKVSVKEGGDGCIPINGTQCIETRLHGVKLYRSMQCKSSICAITGLRGCANVDGGACGREYGGKYQQGVWSLFFARDFSSEKSDPWREEWLHKHGSQHDIRRSARPFSVSFPAENFMDITLIAIRGTKMGKKIKAV